MGVSTWFIQRPIATSLLMAALLGVGIAAFPLLPVAPLPQVDFPTIQVSAQLPGGGVDRRLHVLGGAVDVAAELELQRDGARAEGADRRHLRDAGDLAELAFQRLRHRGGHRLRAAAGQLRRDLDGRKVHLR